MKRSDLFFYCTNGSAGLKGDGTRGNQELLRAGSHRARLEWARTYMALMGTDHLVYWCPRGLTPDRKELDWADYSKIRDDLGPAIREHKRKSPGTLCVYLPSPWTDPDVRLACLKGSRSLLRKRLLTVLADCKGADWIGLDATSSWDAQHAWALDVITAMGFQVLIEGPAARTHPHLKAFGCYVTASHLWKLDPQHTTTFNPADCIGPLIVQHDGTKPDEDAPDWPAWAEAWGRNAIERVAAKKRGVQRVQYTIGVNEPRPDIVFGLTAK